jgi:hypothetical protein
MILEKVRKSGFDTHPSADFIHSDFQKSDFLRVHQGFRCFRISEQPRAVNCRQCTYYSEFYYIGKKRRKQLFYQKMQKGVNDFIMEGKYREII